MSSLIDVVQDVKQLNTDLQASPVDPGHLLKGIWEGAKGFNELATNGLTANAVQDFAKSASELNKSNISVNQIMDGFQLVNDIKNLP